MQEDVELSTRQLWHMDWKFCMRNKRFLESVKRPALFFVFKGVEFETVGPRYNGSPLQIVTGWKLIRTDDVF